MIIKVESPRHLSIAQFCAEELDIPGSYDIIITECCLKEDDALGWTYDIHDNEIDVEIEETLDDEEKLITLCHEMVHVRQAARGDKVFCEKEAEFLEEILAAKYKERYEQSEIN